MAIRALLSRSKGGNQVCDSSLFVVPIAFHGRSFFFFLSVCVNRNNPTEIKQLMTQKRGTGQRAKSG